METEPDPLTLLRLQIGWGADEALAEAPVNRLAATPPARPARRASAPPPAEARPPGV